MIKTSVKKPFTILVMVIVILILSIAFAYILLGGKLFLVLTHPIKFENYINFYAEKTNLSPSLIARLINVESGYKTNAKSNKNAKRT